MYKKPPFPVTPENFSGCWEAIDLMSRNARRKAAISKIGGFWSNLVLLFCLLFVINGLIFSQFDGTYHAFLEDLPWFTDAWNYLAGLLELAGDSLTVLVLKLLLAVYLVSIAVFLLLALLVVILYHPRKQAVPTGNYSEQTTLLAKAAREARDHAYKTHLSAFFSTIILFIVAAVILFGAYAVHRNDPEPINVLLRQFPTGDEKANLTIYVFVCYIVCAAFCEVLLLLTRPLYRYEFPYDYVVQAEAAAIFSQDESATPEQAEAWTLEAMELERIHAYGAAKALLLKAALLGNPSAMEHYARHCLLAHMNDSARYWLKRCVSSGQATKEAKSMLRRMRLRLRHNVRYLQPQEEPLTKSQQTRRKIISMFTLLWRVFILAVLALTVVICVALVKSDMDLNVLKDLSTVMDALLA